MLVFDNFNLVRLFAAWLVLWSHSYPLVGIADDPVKLILGRSGGTVAVDGFF
jgi:hypothetical protein